MWILPTMNRPEQCRDVIDHLVRHGMSTPGRIIVNGRQQEDAYRQIKLPNQWEMEVLPENIGICGVLNKTFREYPYEAWYGVICDDEFVFTDEWDKKLIASAEQWNIAHGCDGWRSTNRIHTYPTIGGDLIRALGWMALPGLWKWYVDDVWELIARDFGLRRHCLNVKTQHRHPENGLAVQDETYLIGNSRTQRDYEVFQDWKQNEYPTLSRRLQEIMIPS